MARRLTEKQLERLRSYRDRPRHAAVGRDPQSSALYMRGLVSITSEVTPAGLAVLEADDRERERAARLEAAQAEVRRVVATGVCPTCGAKLVRNLSLTGWWQCEQLGAVGFRKDPSKPSCSWQGFTS